MAKNILPFDQLTTEGSGFDMVGSAMRKAAAANDIYEGKLEFKAVVVRRIKATNVTQTELANFSGLDPSSAKQSNAEAYRAYRVRIIGESSPHAFLPDPCPPQVTGSANLLITDMHTMAFSREKFDYGDEVMIHLDKRDFSYNLDYCYIVRRLQTNKQRWSRAIGPSSCSQPSTAYMKDMSSVQAIGAVDPNGGIPLTFAGVDRVSSRLNLKARSLGLPEETLETFFEDLIKKLGGKSTPETIKFLQGWAATENTSTVNNPLATTHPGASPKWGKDKQMTIFNAQRIDTSKPELGWKPGVKNYSTYDAGLEATKATLTRGSYNDIVDFLKQKLKDSEGNVVTSASTAAQMPSIVSQLKTWGTTGQYDKQGHVSSGVANNISAGRITRAPFISSKSLGPVTSTEGHFEMPKPSEKKGGTGTASSSTSSDSGGSAGAGSGGSTLVSPEDL